MEGKNEEKIAASEKNKEEKAHIDLHRHNHGRILLSEKIKSIE